MTRNLRKEMETYSNTRIINNIKQHEYYSTESVALAKEIAVERGILNPDQMQSLTKLSAIQKEARELRDRGYDSEDVTREMSRKYNTNNNQTKTAVNQGIASSKNKSSGGIGVLGAIFIIFMIIKFFIRLAQYNSY